MDKISAAKCLSANETDQLASPISVKKKWEFISIFLAFLFLFLMSVYRRKTDQLASPISVKEKREFVFIFLAFLFLFLTSIYRRKLSSKAKYMLKAANVDAASGNDNWTPPPTRYWVLYFMFYWIFTKFSTVKLLSSRRITHLCRLDFLYLNQKPQWLG